MTKEQVEKSYELAKERYATLGVNVDTAIDKMQNISLSLHCWQADDGSGFENPDGPLTGGIVATGNYPGKACGIDQLRADIAVAASFLPGTHRVSLHAIYGDFDGQFVDRDKIEPKHFRSWINWAKENNLKLDFNSTSYSHPLSGSLSLANPDEKIRNFWIEHTKRCRKISEEIGKAQGSTCTMNLWIHDGSKDITVNKMEYRRLLKNSLDQIFEIKYENMEDTIESKLFGIGAESFTVGSHEFYMGYAVANQKVITLDMGHFHLSESVADKISSMLLFVPKITLHVSRPVRWDSDHVVIMNDETLELAKEIVRANVLSRINIGLDYFDASINRIGAYVVGSRATQKCFMQALLEPIDILREYERKGQYFERLAMLEESKALPWNAVWDYFCMINNVPIGEGFIKDIQKYEQEVIFKR
ncbi:MAG: L-rhamnose isomerase [Prolixibacteraceae bacterium]|jgi:L-rhamnose isomerase